MLDNRNIIIEDAKLAWKNFSGHKDEATGWGSEGDRFFNVWINDADFAQQLIDEGYRVSIVPPKNEGELAKHRIKVHVSYRFFTPKVMVGIEGKKFTSYDEEMLDELDKVDVVSADLTLSASKAKNDGLYSFYLREGWFSIRESRWDKKHNYYEEEAPF